MARSATAGFLYSFFVFVFRSWFDDRGGCENSCEEGEVCADGRCEFVEDCTVTGCSGFTYCDQDDRLCKSGCERNDQCTGGQLCNIDHACECPEGEHLCGGQCSPDDSVASCGDRCDPCTTDPNGVASCSESLICELTCDDGYEMCGGACAACPDGPGVLGTTCSGSECVATGCADGYHGCPTGCCAWNKEVVVSGATWSLDLAIDSTDRLHMSYHDYTTFDLRYAMRDTNGWTDESVETTGVVGFGSAIYIDSNDSPHIAHRNLTTGALGYATFDGQSWMTELIAVGSLYDVDVARYSGRAVVSFHDESTDTLKFTERIGLNIWTSTEVDEVTGGGGTSMVIDANGLPRIAYQDAGSEDVRFASFDGSSWSTELVDATGAVGIETSLALDTAGRPHIAYLDLTSLSSVAVKYAYHDGTDWQVSFVDTAHSGEYPTIALDSQDRPHIVYRDLGATALKYAVRQSGAWKIETIDPNGDGGWYARIAIDSQDRPHIVHQDLTSDEIIYVW